MLSTVFLSSLLLQDVVPVLRTDLVAFDGENDDLNERADHGLRFKIATLNSYVIY